MFNVILQAKYFTQTLQVWQYDDRRAVPSALETGLGVRTDWEDGREGSGRIEDLDMFTHKALQGAGLKSQARGGGLAVAGGGGSELLL